MKWLLIFLPLQIFAQFDSLEIVLIRSQQIRLFGCEKQLDLKQKQNEKLGLLYHSTEEQLMKCTENVKISVSHEQYLLDRLRDSKNENSRLKRKLSQKNYLIIGVLVGGFIAGWMIKPP